MHLRVHLLHIFSVRFYSFQHRKWEWTECRRKSKNQVNNILNKCKYCYVLVFICWIKEPWEEETPFSPCRDMVVKKKMLMKKFLLQIENIFLPFFFFIYILFKVVGFSVVILFVLCFNLISFLSSSVGMIENFSLSALPDMIHFGVRLLKTSFMLNSYKKTWVQNRGNQTCVAIHKLYNGIYAGVQENDQVYQEMLHPRWRHHGSDLN